MLLNKDRERKLILMILTFIAIVISICCFKGEKKTANHLSNAIKYMNSGAAIDNKGAAFSVIAKEDAEKIIDYYKKALAELKLIDIEAMNRRYTGFGDHCQQEFINGLELILEGDQKVSYSPKTGQGG